MIIRQGLGFQWNDNYNALFHVLQDNHLYQKMKQYMVQFYEAKVDINFMLV